MQIRLLFTTPDLRRETYPPPERAMRGIGRVPGQCPLEADFSCTCALSKRKALSTSYLSAHFRGALTGTWAGFMLLGISTSLIE